jgi:hypothetical protein
MLADFYGTIRVPPTITAHTRPDLAAAVTRLRRALRRHRLADLIVAVERTGRYHHVPQRAFAAAGFEVRDRGGGGAIRTPQRAGGGRLRKCRMALALPLPRRWWSGAGCRSGGNTEAVPV